MKIKCETCDGKGHVTDRLTTALASLFCGLGIVLYFMQRDQDKGVTRMTCNDCNGKGEFL
jgi:preprotein translocase subunit SecG